MVKENTVQTNEGGNIPLVGPGERPVPKRKLKEGEGVNSVIKELGLGNRKVVIVSVEGVAR
jgi:hypothetical protein